RHVSHKYYVKLSSIKLNWRPGPARVLAPGFLASQVSSTLGPGSGELARGPLGLRSGSRQVHAGGGESSAPALGCSAGRAVLCLLCPLVVCSIPILRQAIFDGMLGFGHPARYLRALVNGGKHLYSKREVHGIEHRLELEFLVRLLGGLLVLVE